MPAPVRVRSAWLSVVLVIANAPCSQVARADDDGEQKLKEPTLEFTPAPLIGASSDLGVGGGVLASLSRRVPGVEPYLWRVELASLTMFKVEQGGLEVPYTDTYLELSLPQLIPHRFKFQARIAYTNEATIKYYGIGNAAPVPKDVSLNDPYYTYSWQHPGLTARLSERVAGPLWLVFTLGYTYNVMQVRPDSKLGEDQRAASRLVADRTSNVGPHSDLTLGYAFELDLRDNEVAPSRGQYHTLRFALSPGGTAGVSGPFARVNASARVYLPLARRMSIAVRAVGDWLIGEPPVYELARFDDIGNLGTGAFGGPNGVRGVPAQRYSGMWKVFGNLEFRAWFLDFHLLSKVNTLGLVVFADAGRLWADYQSHPELDGHGLGLKYGLGAGLRFLGGKTFVIRADVAWSPDARPVGAYLAAGNAF